MDWVMVIVGQGVNENLAIATAQFETKALCEAAAEWLRNAVEVNGSPALVGLCLQAREVTGQ